MAREGAAATADASAAACSRYTHAAHAVSVERQPSSWSTLAVHKQLLHHSCNAVGLQHRSVCVLHTALGTAAVKAHPPVGEHHPSASCPYASIPNEADAPIPVATA